MLNRRGFVGALLGTAALDPERLLWIPGKKLISIPAPVMVPKLSVRQVRIYDPELDRWVHRFDVLYGVGRTIGSDGTVHLDLSTNEALKVIEGTFGRDGKACEAASDAVANAMAQPEIVHSVATLHMPHSGQRVGLAYQTSAFQFDWL